MLLNIYLWLLDILSVLQWEPPWETGIPPEELFEGPNLVLWVLAWIFLSLGLAGLVVLVIHTRYGRELSIKLSVITITTSSIFLGFAFHFFLLHNGL